MIDAHEFKDVDEALDWLLAVAGRTIREHVEYGRWLEAGETMRAAVAYAQEREGMMTRREMLRLWDADTTAMQELSHVPKIENSYLAGRRDGLRMPFGRETLESLSHELAMMGEERGPQDADA